MHRVALAIALIFIVFFAALTVDAVAEQGLGVAGVIAILVLAVMAFGIVGALRHPPEP
jgi:hypothetical protein